MKHVTPMTFRKRCLFLLMVSVHGSLSPRQKQHGGKVQMMTSRKQNDRGEAKDAPIPGQTLTDLPFLQDPLLNMRILSDSVNLSSNKGESPRLFHLIISEHKKNNNGQ